MALKKLWNDYLNEIGSYQKDENGDTLKFIHSNPPDMTECDGKRTYFFLPVYEKDEKLNIKKTVGFVYYYIEEAGTEYLNILECYIDKEHRRKGLMTKMINTIINKHKGSCLELEVLENNIVGQKFWESILRNFAVRGSSITRRYWV